MATSKGLILLTFIRGCNLWQALLNAGFSNIVENYYVNSNSLLVDCTVFHL